MPTLKPSISRHTSFTKVEQDYLQGEFPPTKLRLLDILAEGVLAERVPGFHHFEDDEYSPTQAAEILCTSAFDARWYDSRELGQMNRAVAFAKLQEGRCGRLLSILLRTDAETRRRSMEQAKSKIQNYHVLERKLAS